jgi:hypothetical protein
MAATARKACAFSVLVAGCPAAAFLNGSASAALSSGSVPRAHGHRRWLVSVEVHIGDSALPTYDISIDPIIVELLAQEVAV